MSEVWKDIVGYEGYYQVSDLGNVKSLGNEKTKKDKILKPSLSTNGYYQVGLQINGVRKTYKIHTLVAMSFLNHIPNGTHEVVVDHINTIRTDNNLNNLRLVSSRFNSSRRDRKSNHVGIAYCNFHKKYTAKIFHKGRSKTLGYYITEKEAIESYNNTLNLITTKEDFELEYKDKTSDYRGVSFDKTRNKWVAQIKINYKKYFIGRFNTELEANNAYLKFIEMNKIPQEEPKQDCTCGVCNECEEQETIQILNEAKKML